MARELAGERRAPTELNCGRLRLRFTWRGDRFAHDVLLADERPATVAVRSVEGTADEPWPASPPLQSLHVEEQGGKQVALLVGMAGKCHWSAAVELDAAQSRLRFDVACRVRGDSAARLASSYEAADAVRVLDAGRAVVGGEDGGTLVVRLEGPQSDPNAPASALRLAENRLTIAAAERLALNSAATIRWSYVIEAGAPAP